RFAPSPENERAVIDWARSQGMTITHRYPNRTLVDAEATVATLQRAFGVNIDLYKLKDQSFFSNDRDPAVPAHLAPMLHSVLGLNNLDVFHSASFRQREGSYPDYASGPVYAVGEHHEGAGDRRKLDRAMAERAKGTGPYITMGGYDPADIYSSMAYDYRALANVGY